MLTVRLVSMKSTFSMRNVTLKRQNNIDAYMRQRSKVEHIELFTVKSYKST